MIYFEKNGFQYSTRVFVRKKAFYNKSNGTIGNSRKKSIDIGPWFFFSKTQHTIMRELNRAPFTRKRHRARSVARFCWTLPYIVLYVFTLKTILGFREKKEKKAIQHSFFLENISCKKKHFTFYIFVFN